MSSPLDVSVSEAPSSLSTGGRRRVLVLCLTYGEPAQNAWVPQFRYSLSILNRLTRQIAPIPRAVTPLLAARRAWKRATEFRRLAWSSPLEEISRSQVEFLQAELETQDPDTEFRTRLVFEFRTPYLWDVLAQESGWMANEVVVVPLYVAESDFTSGVSRRDFSRLRNEGLAGIDALDPPRYVLGFGYDARMGQLLADHVQRHCRDSGWTDQDCRHAVLILGAHGTLLRPPPGVNSGARETRCLFGAIRGHLRERFASVRLGWLNHTMGGTWTFPEVTDSARESQAVGIQRAVYFPFGFLADNGESQLEGQRQLAEFSWDRRLDIPCPNASPELIRLLAVRVREALEAPPLSWSDFAPAPAARANF